MDKKDHDFVNGKLKKQKVGDFKYIGNECHQKVKAKIAKNIALDFVKEYN